MTGVREDLRCCNGVRKYKNLKLINKLYVLSNVQKLNCFYCGTCFTTQACIVSLCVLLLTLRPKCFSVNSVTER